jgi:3-oxoacyl-[acyl-carrier-protein] synthase-3
LNIRYIEFQLASTAETLAELGAINPDWRIERLFKKTGIRRHYVSGAGETTSSLAEQVCRRLLSNCDSAGIDGLIYVTQSPESTIPSTACLLQARLGLPSDIAVFDLIQGCSGFVYGLSVAASLMRGAGLQRLLIVCSETYSKYISLHDRTSRPIFSDGAAAVLLDAEGPGKIGPFVFRTDGTGAPDLTLVTDDVARDVAGPVLHMNGPKVLQYTVTAVPDAVEELLAKAELSVKDIDLFVFHQASAVVLGRLQRRLGIDDERWYVNIEDTGNTVSATIPIALKQAEEQHRLTAGMTVMLMGYGVGFSIAGCIIRT